MVAFKKNPAKKVLRIILISLIIFIVFSFVSTIIIYDLTFPRYDPEAEISVPETLTETVENRKETSFKSGENDLKGYIYGGGGKALVVVTPGFFASADDYLYQIKSFIDHGFGVFVFDTTGSGESEGDSSVGFPQTVIDLDAALDHIESNGCFGYEEILLFGHSRGGYAVCSVLNGEHDIAAVVSVAGANSAMEAVIVTASDYVGFLAYGNYPFLWLYQTLLFGNEIANIKADEMISGSDVPVLIIQGTEDETFPTDKGSIYSHRSEITSSNVEYIICDAPGQNGHTDLLFDSDGEENEKLMKSINDFYDRCLKQ